MKRILAFLLMIPCTCVAHSEADSGEWAQRYRVDAGPERALFETVQIRGAASGITSSEKVEVHESYRGEWFRIGRARTDERGAFSLSVPVGAGLVRIDVGGSDGARTLVRREELGDKIHVGAVSDLMAGWALAEMAEEQSAGHAEQFIDLFMETAAGIGRSITGSDHLSLAALDAASLMGDGLRESTMLAAEQLHAYWLRPLSLAQYLPAHPRSIAEAVQAAPTGLGAALAVDTESAALHFEGERPGESFVHGRLSRVGDEGSAHHLVLESGKVEDARALELRADIQGSLLESGTAMTGQRGFREITAATGQPEPTEAFQMALDAAMELVLRDLEGQGRDLLLTLDGALDLDMSGYLAGKPLLHLQLDELEFKSANGEQGTTIRALTPLRISLDEQLRLSGSVEVATPGVPKLEIQLALSHPVEGNARGVIVALAKGPRALASELFGKRGFQADRLSGRITLEAAGTAAQHALLQEGEPVRVVHGDYMDERLTLLELLVSR